MARTGRQTADDALALEVAAGRTLREAAQAAGVGERTARRRWADPGFRARVEALRADMLKTVLGRMTDGMTDAADTLRTLLRSESDSVKLGAARALLELGARLRETVELEGRLAALEAKQ